MDRQQFSWLIVRAFGVYLLIQAFMLGLSILGEVYTVRIYNTLASSSGTKNDYVSAVLLSYRSSMLPWLLKFVVLSATGIYFLRGGRFLMRWLQYVPNSPTHVGGESDAQQIVGRERRERVS